MQSENTKYASRNEVSAGMLDILTQGADARTGESARTTEDVGEDAAGAAASGAGAGADEVRESAEPYRDRVAIGATRSSNAICPSINDPSIGVTPDCLENPAVEGFAVEFMFDTDEKSFVGISIYLMLFDVILFYILLPISL